MIELQVLGLTMDSTTNAPILVLKAVDGEDVLPLWIGGSEALSVALALGQTVPDRPLSHELTMRILDGLDARIVGLSITDVRGGIFYGALDVVCGERFLQIDCRPSDGIALALRAQAPIRVDPLVLARAPRERFHAAVAGQAPLPDEAGTIVRRTLRQLGPLLDTVFPDSPRPKPSDAAQSDIAEADRKPVLPAPPGLADASGDGPAFGAKRHHEASCVDGSEELGLSGEEDSFARLLRELEPASKHRM